MVKKSSAHSFYLDVAFEICYFDWTELSLSWLIHSTQALLTFPQAYLII